MRTKRVWLCCVLVCSGLGCRDSGKPSGSEGSPATDSASVKDGAPVSVGNPADYFPMEVGYQWKYRIELGSVEPTRYGQIRWPTYGGQHSLVYATWSRFMGAVRSEIEVGEPSKKKSFVLEYRIKGVAKQQGILEFPRGVELEIVKDELGVFDQELGETKQVFWAATEDWDVVEVRIKDGSRSPVSSGYMSSGGPDGSEIHLIYFHPETGAMKGLGSSADAKDKDIILSVGPHRDGKSVSFVRAVGTADLDKELKGLVNEPQNQHVPKEAVEESDKLLGRGFTEHVTYEKGKGLVRLVQFVDKNVSMTWTLEEVKKP